VLSPGLFGELMLLPEEELATPEQRERLAAALDGAAARVLQFDDDDDAPAAAGADGPWLYTGGGGAEGGGGGAKGGRARAREAGGATSALPKLRFDALLGAPAPPSPQLPPSRPAPSPMASGESSARPPLALARRSPAPLESTIAPCRRAGGLRAQLWL
jgi:hypothetical protein